MRTLFSCIVDNHPRLRAQCFLWVGSLLHYQHVDPARVFVHAVPPMPAAFRGWLERQRITVVPSAAFDPRSPHCNKLRQLATFADPAFSTTTGQVVLMDCDTVWLGERPLPRAAPVAAKVVDGANPAPEILRRIFAAAGFGEPEWIPVCFPSPATGTITDRNNCNGGVYIVECSYLASLSEVWSRWARWCLEHADLFERSIHFDQVSYALAARELGIPTQLLGPEWNFPTHYPNQLLPDIRPQIAHYHRRFTADLQLLAVGVPTPDAMIAAFNQIMTPYIQTHFNEVYAE